MYSFDETYCLTTRRKNELAKNIGIVQTELDKAQTGVRVDRVDSRWCSNNSSICSNDKNQHGKQIQYRNTNCHYFLTLSILIYRKTLLSLIQKDDGNID